MGMDLTAESTDFGARLVVFVFKTLVILAACQLAWRFGLHPWLAGQLAGAQSQLPTGTLSLMAHPAEAIRQVVGAANGGQALP